MWKKWQVWDERRYNYQVRLFERKHKKKQQKGKGSPKKRKASTANEEEATKMDLATPPVSPAKQAVDSATKSENTMSIPKKNKRPLDGDIASPTMSIPKKKRHF